MSTGSFRSHPYCFLLVLLLFCFCGCANGPARMHLNGKFRYITVETVRQCSWEKCLYGVPAAAVTDVGIFAADTLLVPVDALWKICSYASPPFWVFWLPLYPWGCFVMPFAYEEEPDDHGALLYRRYWGLRYFDSINGDVQLYDLNDQLGRSTRIVCNKQVVGTVFGQVERLASSQGHLAVLTRDRLLYWWRHDDTAWMPQHHNYVLSNDDLLEYGRRELAPREYERDKWKMLQTLTEQAPDECKLGSTLYFRKGSELYYHLNLTYQSYEISVECSIQPTDEKPRVVFLSIL